MAQGSESVRRQLARMLEAQSADDAAGKLNRRGTPMPPRVPGASLVSPEAIERRWRLVHSQRPTLDGARAILCDDAATEEAPRFARNIENLIGFARVPIGLAGPLRVNGLFAQDDFYIPLATTEAALVASYHRGCMAVSEAGGSSVAVLMEGVTRAPGFVFRTLAEAGQFVAWCADQVGTIREQAEATTRFGRLNDVRFHIEGNHVYLCLEFTTGDAAGQNMVTVATQAACDWIIAHTPVAPRIHFVEANLSGDKKASVQSFQSVRGKKVCAEVVLPAALVARRLRSTARDMETYWRMSALGGVMSGSIGVQGHYANGLAALYLATGQDAACVAESAVGVTRFELMPETGDLYAAVTLPNIIVGSVGGGTGLPTQRACLEILGLAGAGKAQALAEVCAAVALAGELSIIAALAAGEFTRAHAKLARGAAAPHPAAGRPTHESDG